jgi:hypothetical protein
MSFLVRSGRPLSTRTLDSWRAAARLAAVRWEMFLAADRPARSAAFAAYTAALDAEAAAAERLAHLRLGEAA